MIFLAVITSIKNIDLQSKGKKSIALTLPLSFNLFQDPWYILSIVSTAELITHSRQYSPEASLYVLIMLPILCMSLTLQIL